MKDATDITILLDRSGSMEIIRQDTRGGFNRFIEDQKKVPGEAALTLVQFDDRYEPNYREVPIGQVPLLTDETYQPRGSTALLDALARTINEAGARLAAKPEHERPNKVIFVVITDGHENASHEFKREQIFKMLRLQQDVYKWEFVFLGANQDSFAEAGAMGFNAYNVANYHTTPTGTAAAFASVGRGMAAYRGGVVLNSSHGYFGNVTDVEDVDEDVVKPWPDTTTSGITPTPSSGTGIKI